MQNQKWEWDSLEADKWHTLNMSGILADADADGNPLQSVIPILSFFDKTNDVEPGVAAYIDNFKLKVTVPNEDQIWPSVPSLITVNSLREKAHLIRE